MTDKTIIKATSRELMAADNKSAIENVTRKLMKLAPGGRKLTPDMAVELAIASYVTGANPFVGEIYNTEYGIMLGYPYFLRKGNEQIARETGKPGSIKSNYHLASHDDAVFDESKNDIAWTCSLWDTATEQENFDQTTKLFTLMCDKGIPGETAWKLAEKKVGPVPRWEASAVVYGSETFGKTEKWDRNERAKKRALKAALKKRFSDLEYVDSGDVVIIEGEARDVAAKITQEYIEEKTAIQQKTPQEIITELYGDPPAPANFTEGQAEEVQEQSEERHNRPYPPAILKERIELAASMKGKTATDRDRKVLAKQLSTLCGGDDTKRYEFSGWLLGASSTKDMSDGHVLAALAWLGVSDFNDPPVEYALREYEAAAAEALKQQGQLDLGV